MERLLLKPSEVAETLGICRTKAYGLISSGAIPSMRVGCSVRVPAESLKAWIASATGESGRDDK
ncbi:MAG TPA: helix-turn-helix domain-containing protein [Vicinamibacterales bacterium]|nr:helix-turn-helix domain-containing protein [Vicinamibacterales bacterium]